MVVVAVVRHAVLEDQEPAIRRSQEGSEVDDLDVGVVQSFQEPVEGGPPLEEVEEAERALGERRGPLQGELDGLSARVRDPALGDLSEQDELGAALPTQVGQGLETVREHLTGALPGRLT